MAKHGKNYNQAREKVEARPYSVADAVDTVKGNAFAKFDETVEVALKLGVDPRHADQMVRDSVVLPHGLGRTVRVLVIAQGEKVKEAEEAGADYVGGEDMVEKVQGGWIDFEAVVATPDMMREVGKLGRVLGPRGLMPNPKSGTVTFDVAKAVDEIKSGKLDFRVDKNGVVHASVGKVSFEAAQLNENLRAVFDAILRNKPASSKGKYIRSIYLTSTMGPSVQVDPAEIAVQ